MRTSQSVWIVYLATILAAKSAFASPPAEAKPNDKPAVDISAGIPAGEAGAAEVRIEKALDELTEIEFSSAPLSDVIDFLTKRHQINIQIDKKALEEAGVATDSEVTRNVKNISLRSALRLVLRDLDLSFVIRDEVLLITTSAAAEVIFQIRLYPVSDLLDHAHQDSLRGDPSSDLIATIVASVAPTTWSEVGGPGAIKYLPVVESLVITQTGDVHEEVCSFLVAARKVRALEQPKHHAANVDPNQMFVEVYWLEVSKHVYRVATEPMPASDKDAKPAADNDADPVAPARALVISKRALADDLANVVPKLIEPTTWQAGGGHGSIESIGVGVAVRQTRRVHLQVARFLESVERAKAHPTAAHGMEGGGMFRISDR